MPKKLKTYLSKDLLDGFDHKVTSIAYGDIEDNVTLNVSYGCDDSGNTQIYLDKRDLEIILNFLRVNEEKTSGT